MNRDFYVGKTRTGEFWRNPDRMLTHTLFEGAGESGKTTAARLALAFLAWQRPNLPMLILDGVGTLANTLYEQLVEEHYRADVPGIPRHVLLDRVLFLKLSAEDASGLSIDLLKLREKPGRDGQMRRETYAERVDTIMGTLAHTTEGSEDFKLVHKYGRAALTCLVAAHRPPEELSLILDGMHPFAWLGVLQEIERFRHADCAAAKTDGRRLDQEIEVIEGLYRMAGSRLQEFERLAGSTLRHFQWLWKDCAHLFNRDAFDYGAFHDRGGILIIESAHEDPTTSANLRRIFYGLRHAHIASRRAIRTDHGPRFDPSLVVIDEQEGMNAALYVAGLANARNRADYHWFLFQSANQIGERGMHYDSIAAVMDVKVLFRPGSKDDAERSAWLIHDANPEGMLLATETASEQESEGETQSRGTSTSRSQGYKTSSGSGTNQHEQVVTYRVEGPERAERHVVRDAPAETYGEDTSESESDTEGVAHSRGRSHVVSRGRERVSVHEQVQIFARHLMQLERGAAFYVSLQRGRPVLVQHRHCPPTSNTCYAEHTRETQYATYSKKGSPRPALPFIVLPPKVKAEPAPQAASAPGTVEKKKPVRKKKVDAPAPETA